MNDRELALELLDYIQQGPTPFHVVARTARVLEQAGFTQLDERDAWKLRAGDKRYVARNGSSLIAFAVGSSPPEQGGFCIVGAHTDSPCLKLKPNAAGSRHGYRQLGVEPYGGLLLSTWLDRDLGLAGRVLVGCHGTIEPRTFLVHVDRPWLRIPNVAIHLNREVNTKGLILDQQQHMPPILGMASDAPESIGDLRQLLARLLAEQQDQNVDASDILDFDLTLVDTHRGALGGADEEFLFSARIDNLASCHGALSGLCRSVAGLAKAPTTRMIALWDNEECGSRSMQGAQGPFLRQVLERIVEARSPNAPQAAARAIASSFLISSDMAHAIHPNYADRHEPQHAPELGKGPVLKYNANQSYASDGESAARFAAACKASGFEPQRFVVRSDMPCGSTIGPITAALTGIKTVDVGNPMLSMHSIREMASVRDHARMTSVLTVLFNGVASASVAPTKPLRPPTTKAKAVVKA
ncbi:MAG: M18 family aminopeptidase [Polyangiaceae bacterium]|jgi:aspartyl aminopeptidase|nr:M18 family aminopeptidase [Polyangiaceae bacterium]